MYICRPAGHKNILSRIILNRLEIRYVGKIRMNLVCTVCTVGQRDMCPASLWWSGRRELLWSARKCTCTVLLLASLQPPRGGTQRRNLKEECLGFLEKTQTFEKSLLRDNNLVEFFFPSRLHDPDEQNRLPIGHLFATRWAMTLPSPHRASSHRASDDFFFIS
jgi:hypothetical protein